MTNGGTFIAHDLDRIGDSAEIEITSPRADATLRPFVPIWVTRVGDELYVRSWKGSGAGWYRHLLAAGEGSIRVDDRLWPIRFETLPTDDPAHAAIDAVYASKYARFGAEYVDAMVAPAARETTLRLVAAST
ncbi:DUF2255 family protein [Galbitalea soli]|uniref:DUF2255 family protein n=1 Tax=Galbitalea soli TaxID=1268042 RepID=A0A7C9TR10_9MICO|nr:DUF2255 family protein [Galbitalea soli]NEM91140.1 DUF2255 family protein [Galbitalea soli]NYJ29829.1 hypothetical protein [Galbitalea soli]